MDSLPLRPDWIFRPLVEYYNDVTDTSHSRMEADTNMPLHVARVLAFIVALERRKVRMFIRAEQILFTLWPGGVPRVDSSRSAHLPCHARVLPGVWLLR